MINGARSELSREPAVWWTLTGAFFFMFVLVLAANLFPTWCATLRPAQSWRRSGDHERCHPPAGVRPRVRSRSGEEILKGVSLELRAGRFSPWVNPAVATGDLAGGDAGCCRTPLAITGGTVRVPGEQREQDLFDLESAKMQRPCTAAGGDDFPERHDRAQPGANRGSAGGRNPAPAHPPAGDALRQRVVQLFAEVGIP